MILCVETAVEFSQIPALTGRGYNPWRQSPCENCLKLRVGRTI